MSLLSQIKKQKNRLKETETVVMTVDGQRFIEKRTEENTFDRKDCPSRSFGFVVDTHPDDTPAMLIDNLYIGSQDCTGSHVLQKYNINHVLSVGINVDNINVKCKFVECLDLPETNLEVVLEKCMPFIKDALDANENILIHCNAGVSRAAAVALGYLIKEKGMSFDNAYSLAKTKRPAIQPNVGFQRQLKNFCQKNTIISLNIV